MLLLNSLKVDITIRPPLQDEVEKNAWTAF